jgi:hypothetical protein
VQILTLLLLLHFAADDHINGQTRKFFTIEGKIKDRSTLEPLEGVNVFLNSTTLGSATDIEGKYKILNVPVGYFELVISMVGYETKKKVISIDRKNIRGLDFNISPVSIEIDQIDVYAERDDDWDDQFKLFFDYFIGTSKNAAECKIVNKEIIDFKLSSDKKTLKAAAKDRLEIINEALGYRMFINLMEFNLNRSGETDYLCEAYFQELETTDPVIQYNWEQNRKEAYLGSAKHFLVALTNHDLFDEGFRVYNTEFPSWPQLTKFDYSRPWLEEEVDTVSSWERSLKHNYFVKVVYLHEAEEENYYFYRKQQGSNLYSIHHVQTSWFKLPFGYVSFDTTGNILHETGNMKIWGYWGWKRMADLLPKDYFPGEEQ